MQTLHRGSAKNVRFIACQDFVSRGTCLSDHTRHRQFSEAGVKTTVMLPCPCHDPHKWLQRHGPVS